MHRRIDCIEMKMENDHKINDDAMKRVLYEIGGIKEI